MKKVIGRSRPSGVYIEITLEIRDGTDGLSRCFSTTSLLWEKHGTWDGRACKRNGREPDVGGQLTDEVRRAAPKLEPFLRVHLADLDGVPMHARANGWYFYSGGHLEYELKHYGQAYVDRLGTPHERAACALNIPPADLPEGMSEEQFNEFCASLTSRWKRQADDARAVFDALVDGEGVEE